MRRRGVTVAALVLLVAIVSTATGAAASTNGRHAPSISLTTDVSYGRNPAQRADVFVPRADANGATVVLIHGGGWVGGDKHDLKPEALRLAQLGYVVVSLNYRLAPRHLYPAAIDDVTAAVKWFGAPSRAQRFGIDPQRIGVVGYSAGGQLAAMLATTDQRVSAAVSLSGVYDFSTFDDAALFLGCDAAACPARARAASPIDHVHPDARPLLMVSSADDPIVSAGQLTEMDAALGDVDAPHVGLVVPGDGHATTLPMAAWLATAAFLAVSLDVPIPPM
jgi:acetyl esterase/lipase